MNNTLLIFSLKEFFSSNSPWFLWICCYKTFLILWSRASSLLFLILRYFYQLGTFCTLQCIHFVLTRIILSEHGQAQNEGLTLKVTAPGDWQVGRSGFFGMWSRGKVKGPFSSWPEPSLTLHFLWLILTKSSSSDCPGTLVGTILEEKVPWVGSQGFSRGLEATASLGRVP